MPFELRNHTADVAVAAHAESLEGVFASVADGLAAAMCDEIPDANDGDGQETKDRDRFSVSVAAGSREALLYDYLADLIYERDVRGVLPVDNEVTIREPTTEGRHGTADRERPPDGSAADESANEGADDGTTADSWQLDATARGVTLSAVDAREVKAVTYSEMELEATAEGWRSYVVFDV